MIKTKMPGLYKRSINMFREITSELIKWKDKASRKPLLMLGVRQCGKTYIIKEFARDHFNEK